jgi:hypothetical protein
MQLINHLQRSVFFTKKRVPTMRRNFARIGEQANIESTAWSGYRGATVAGVFIGAVALILAIVTISLASAWNLQNVKTINGVPPASGEVTEVAGAGINITPLPLTHQLRVENTGVLSASAGTGISVTPSSTGHVTIGNTGVLRLVPGPAIGVSSPPTGIVTVTNNGVRSLAAGNSGVAVGSGTVGDLVVNNTGVLANAAGAGISIVSTGSPSGTGTVTITNAGVLSALAGPGISVSSSTGAVTITNAGVRSVTSLPGSGITVTPANGTGTVQLFNAGVTGLTAGTGITLSGTTGNITVTSAINLSSLSINSVPFTVGGNAIIAAADGLGISTGVPANGNTLFHTITRQTALPKGDSQGTVMGYTGSTLAFVSTGPAPYSMIWYVPNIVGAFDGNIFPGALPGEGGQGNINGTMWRVPATGTYVIDSWCSLVKLPSSPIPNNNIENIDRAFMTISFNANTTDPASGFTEMRWLTTTVLPALTFSLPTVLSSSVTVQAGCPGCNVQVGNLLMLHFSLVRPIASSLYIGTCEMQIARVV